MLCAELQLSIKITDTKLYQLRLELTGFIDGIQLCLTVWFERKADINAQLRSEARNHDT